MVTNVTVSLFFAMADFVISGRAPGSLPAALYVFVAYPTLAVS
jgi:hypothetical protein